MTDITAFSHACTNFSHSGSALQDTAVLLRTSLLWQQCECVSVEWWAGYWLCNANGSPWVTSLFAFNPAAKINCNLIFKLCSAFLHVRSILQHRVDYKVVSKRRCVLGTCMVSGNHITTHTVPLPPQEGSCRGHFWQLTFMWDFKFSRRRVWCSELSSGMYCRVKSSSLMMEAVRTSETSVDNHFTRQYIPEDNSEQLTFSCAKVRKHLKWKRTWLLLRCRI
jgi:hypothetical protein